MPFDPKKLEELRARHGSDVIALEATVEATGEVVTVAVKRPSPQTYSRYRQHLFDDARRHVANEVLIVDCVVFPEDQAARQAIFEKYPGLIDSFAGEAAKLAGGGVAAKKL